MGQPQVEGGGGETLSERDVIEKVKTLINLRRYLNPSLIDFIEQIQSYEFIPEITRVAEDMGLHASTVWKFMNLLRSKGFAFTIITDIQRLGLEYIVMIFDDYLPYDKVFKSTLREYSPLLPWGTLLTYLVPSNMSEVFINELAPTIPKEPVKIIRLTYTVPSKPSLSMYYDLRRRRVKLIWNELFNTIIATPREVVPREVIRRGKFDEIDMFILKELELDPFMSLKKITEKLNKELKPSVPINYIRILRHYKNHIEARGVVRGVKLRLTPIIGTCSMPLITIIKGNPADVHRVCRILTTHPYFTSSYMNPEMGIGVINVCLPIREVFNYSLFLRSLEREKIIREWSVYILDKLLTKKFTLPYNIFSKSIIDMVKEFKVGKEKPVVSEIREEFIIDLDSYIAET